MEFYRGNEIIVVLNHMAQAVNGGLLDLEKELSCSVGRFPDLLYKTYYFISSDVLTGLDRFAPKFYISR